MFENITKELDSKLGQSGEVVEKETEPIEGMKPGTSGLRKKVRERVKACFVSLLLRSESNSYFSRLYFFTIFRSNYCMKTRGVVDWPTEDPFSPVVRVLRAADARGAGTGDSALPDAECCPLACSASIGVSVSWHFLSRCIDRCGSGTSHE